MKKIIHPRITFKVTPTSFMDGIGEFWDDIMREGVPTGIASIMAAGPIRELMALTKDKYPDLVDKNFYHYRIVGTNGSRYVDVPAYEMQPADAALTDYTYHLIRWQNAFADDWQEAKKYVWFTVNNELDATRTEWLAQYFLHLLDWAAVDGIKMGVAAWAAGTPTIESWEGPWAKKLLQYLREHPNTAALDLHEYSYEAHTLEEEKDLIGRWREIPGIDEVTVFFTEFGWAERDMPERAIAMEQLEDAYAEFYAEPNMLFIALWTLDRNQSGLHFKMHDLMAPLIDYCANVYFIVDDSEDETEEPQPAGKNLLKNPSFEGGWTDLNGSMQEPHFWTVAWFESGEDTLSGQKYQMPEGVHKFNTGQPGSLPPNEWWMVHDGNTLYKLFAGNKPFQARLKQIVNFPEVGTYRLTVRAVVDVYRGNRDYDVEKDSALFSVSIDSGEKTTMWTSMIGSAGQSKFEKSYDLYIDTAGEHQVAFRFRCPWAISNNLFLDGWEITKMNTTPPTNPVEKHKAIVVMVPQTATKKEWQDAAEYAYDFRHTVTASHDDMLTIIAGGDSEESFVKVVKPSEQPDVVKLLNDKGINWTSILEQENATFEFSNWPTDYKVVTQEFAANPLLYAKYNLPGHEGVDFRAPLNSNIYTVQDGLVSKIVRDETIPYGNHIIIDHADGYKTLYAHLTMSLVSHGQKVYAGEIIGLAGSTGNSDASHLHLTLYKNGSNYKSISPYTGKELSWPNGIIDPTPFLESFESVTWPGGAPGIPAVPQPPLYDIGECFPENAPLITLKHYGGPHNGHEEHIQYRTDLGILVKDSNYEEVYVTENEIRRRVDTSPNEEEFYIVIGPNSSTDAGAKWMDRFMKIGGDSVSTKRVEFYDKRTGKSTRPPYGALDKIRLVKVAPWTNEKVYFETAYYLEWILPNGTADEQWVFVPGVGMVEWRKLIEGWGTRAVAIQQYGTLPLPAVPAGVKIVLGV